MTTRKKKNNIGAFGHPIYGKGFAKYGEMRPNGSSEIPKDLEEAANKFAVFYDQGTCDGIAQDCFIAGAKWQKEQDEKDLSEKTAAAYQLGLADKEKQMMSEAVEGYVNYYEDSGGILMAEAQVGCPYHSGDKVRIIVCKKED